MVSGQEGSTGIHPVRRPVHRSPRPRYGGPFRHQVLLLHQRHQEQVRLLPPPVGEALQGRAGQRTARGAAVQVPRGPLLVRDQRQHRRTSSQALRHRTQSSSQVHRGPDCRYVSMRLLSSKHTYTWFYRFTGFLAHHFGI